MFNRKKIDKLETNVRDLKNEIDQVKKRLVNGQNNVEFLNKTTNDMLNYHFSNYPCPFCGKPMTISKKCSVEPICGSIKLNTTKYFLTCGEDRLEVVGDSLNNLIAEYNRLCSINKEDSK